MLLFLVVQQAVKDVLRRGETGQALGKKDSPRTRPLHFLN